MYGGVGLFKKENVVIEDFDKKFGVGKRVHARVGDFQALLETF